MIITAIGSWGPIAIVPAFFTQVFYARVRLPLYQPFSRKFFAQVFSLFSYRSFSYKFFAQVLVPFSVKTRFEQQSTFSPLLQQQQRFLFHPISLVIISLNIVSLFDRISPCNMYQHDWRSGMKTGFAYVCPWIVTVINNKNECHQQHVYVKQS